METTPSFSRIITSKSYPFNKFIMHLFVLQGERGVEAERRCGG